VTKAREHFQATLEEFKLTLKGLFDDFVDQLGGNEEEPATEVKRKPKKQQQQQKNDKKRKRRRQQEEEEEEEKEEDVVEMVNFRRNPPLVILDDDNDPDYEPSRNDASAITLPSVSWRISPHTAKKFKGKGFHPLSKGGDIE